MSSFWNGPTGRRSFANGGKLRRHMNGVARRREEREFYATHVYTERGGWVRTPRTWLGQLWHRLRYGRIIGFQGDER